MKVRHGVSYFVLAAIGGTIAFLLMIVSRVTLNESFVNWIRNEPWYTELALRTRIS